jgi:hypothetical protein
VAEEYKKGQMFFGNDRGDKRIFVIGRSPSQAHLF